ncbi:MAG: transporter substrate-binding domain-containing protein [Clostridia bacterium]|nr:transporter substrate-binding domain-containing protein [Clostridia bacterium]
MKKFLTAILAAVLCVCGCFGLTACSDTPTVKIGAQTGTTGYMFASYLKGTEAKAYQSPTLAVTDMQNGVIDYVVTDKAVAQNLVDKIEGIKMIDVALTGEEFFGMAVDSTQTELLAQVNAFFVEKAAEINAIQTKYLTGDEANYVAVPKNVEVTGATETLKIATNAEYAPFEFKQGEDFYGIDMEVAKLLAEYLGMNLEIVDMAFSAVVTSVGTDGIDMAIAALTITNDREENINFTDAYYTNSQVIVCLEENEALDDAGVLMDILAVLCANG